MLRWILGDDYFFKGVRQYLEDPKIKHGFARTADLQRNLEQVSGKNLSTFFQKWIYGEGYANYSATWRQNSNNWAKVKLNQTTSHNSVSFYEMPVELVFVAGTQRKSFVVDHRYSGQDFWLDVGFVADTMMIDPNIWILAKNKTAVKESVNPGKSDELLVFPNPSPGNGNILLKNPTGKLLSVQLFNSVGQLIYSKSWQTLGSDELFTVPMANLPRGGYLLSIRNDKDLKVMKKIIH